MAKQNHTVFDPWIDPCSEMSAPGVRSWRGLDWQFFSGKAEALIACGLAQAAWFPADWKQRKLTVDGRSITVRRNSKSHFRVLAEYLPEEKEQYELAVKKDRELKEAKERLDGEEKDLARLPKTAEAFKAELLYVGTLIPEAVIRGMSTSDSGFRFDEDTIVEMKRLNAEMEFCLQHGRIVFDPAVQADTFARHKAARAKADPNFQKVMARLKDAPE